MPVPFAEQEKSKDMPFRNSVKQFSVTSDGKCRKFTEKKSQNILQKLPTACIIPVRTLAH